MAERQKVPKGLWRISLGYSYKNADERVEGKERTSNPYQVVNTYSMHVVGIEYGLSEITNLTVTIPWSYNYREFMIPDTGDRFRYRTNGLGDISVIGKTFFTRNNLMGFAEVGLSIPTGKADEQNEFGFIPSFIQCGTGLFVPVLGVGSNWSKERWFSFVNLRYIMAGLMGANDAGYEFQNQTRWSLGAMYSAPRNFSLGLKLDGLSINGWDYRDGVRVNNTGGRWMSLTPSISYSPNDKYSLGFSFIKPIYWNVHSNQAIEPHEVKFSLSLY